jgi:HEAT repeat protein
MQNEHSPESHPPSLTEGAQASEAQPAALPSRETEAAEQKRIAELAAHLRYDNPLRPITRDVLKEAPLSPETIQFLIEILRNPSLKPLWARETLAWISDQRRAHPEHTEREITAFILGRAPLDAAAKEAAADALARTLDNDRTIDKRITLANVGRGLASGTRFLAPVSAAIGLAIGACNALSYPGFGVLQYLAWTAIILIVLEVLLSPFFVGALLEQNWLHLSRMRAAAATALGHLRLPESVDSLARADNDDSPEVRDAAIHALDAVLPTLTPDHYGRLGSQTVPNLYRILYAGDESFKLRVLAALEKVGDGRAIAPLKRVATRQLFGATERLSAEAARILPILEARQRQETERGTLLRGSHAAPTATPDTLLRPAAEPSETPPEELLRPHSDEEK